MSAIVPQNYEAVPLGEKFAWVHGQPGMRAVEAAADSVRTMGERLGTITTDAGRSMRGLGVTWAGPASEAAQRSSGQIVARAADTQSLADNGAARILDYGRSFDEMRKRIAFEDPSQLSWVELAMEPSRYAWDLRPWAEGEDHVSVLRRNQEHDAAANDALRWHEANARAADDGFVTDGRPPPAVPVGATAVGSESGGHGSGAVTSSAPPPVATAAASPSVASSGAAPSAAAPSSVAAPASGAPISAPAAGAAPPGSAAVPVPGTPGAVLGQAGSGAGGGAAGPGAAPGRGGSAASGDARQGATGVGPGGTTAPRAGGVSATGPAAAAGAGGAGRASGLADPAQERMRRGAQIEQDLARNSPAARANSGPGAGGGPGGGWYGSGGRPAAGSTGQGRPAGGWGPSGSDGRSPLTGGPGARPGSGAVGWRGGGGTGGWAPGGPGGGVGDPSRLPGEGGSRTWSRAPGIPAEGPLARPVAGEPVTGRGAGYGPGYAPMMAGAGGLRSDGDAHRNRYLLPTSEPFDVELPHAPPVLAPEEDG